MTDINTEYGVLVLGDSDTAGRMDMLADKAAEQGAVITQTYAFDPGEAANHEDLTCVGAVVEALLAPGRYLVLPVHTPGGRAGRANQPGCHTK